MGYDAVLIHPPSIYDFRKKASFPGPIAHTVRESSTQFTIPPVGMLSIAEYLDRHSYRVIVDNLCERMVDDKALDVENHIRGLSSRVFAIGLNWCVHSQGALEIARICKEHHPQAMVILGGLTATVFSQEILRCYPQVDGVIRGESEKPFFKLMSALGQDEKLKDVPNLTFRDSRGNIISNPLMTPVDSLDEYEFTRLDLITPSRTIFPPGMSPRWYIPVCRGCVYNCATCGGSRYSYKTYLGRDKPAFRSPKKIIDDIYKLNEQGVQRIFLFQDPRMGGRDYWKQLVSLMHSDKIAQTQLTMELFGPADEDYLRSLKNTGVPIVLSISPESCVDSVRQAHGRRYNTKELLNTAKLCKKHGIPLGIFSMIALAEDTYQTVEGNWKVWEEICQMEHKVKGKAPVHFAFGPMILLDPGSPAFDHPEQYGFNLLFKNLTDYVHGMSQPSWHQWISYQTRFLQRDEIAELILDSIKESINLREKYSLSDAYHSDMDRLLFVTTNYMIINTINDVMDMQTEEEKLEALQALKRSLDELQNKNIPNLEYT